MKEPLRKILGVLLLLASIGLFSGGAQQWTGDASFQSDAELLFVGALLLLVSSLGILFKRPWTVTAWRVTLLYYVAAAVFAVLLPAIRDNERTLAAHRYPGLSLGMWAFTTEYLATPLIVGLILLRFLPALVTGGTGDRLASRLWNAAYRRKASRVLLSLFALFVVANLLSLYDPAPDASSLQVASQPVAQDKNAFYPLQEIRVAGADQYGQLPASTRALANGTDWNQAAAQSFVAANGPALRLFNAASALPQYRDPLLDKGTPANGIFPISNIGSFQAGASLALVNAGLLKRAGREDEAIAQAMAVVRLGRTVQQSEGFVIQWLDGTRLKQSGVSWLQREMATGNLTSTELQGIQAALGPDLDDTGGLQTALKVERSGGIHGTKPLTRSFAAQEFGESSWLAYLPYSFQPNRTEGYRIANFQRQIAEADLPCRDVAGGPTEPVSTIGNTLRYLSPNGYGKGVYDLSTGSTADLDYVKCGDQFAVEAAQVTAGLYAYYLAHGTYPDSLAPLVPDFMPSLPKDPYDLQPLGYDPKAGTVFSTGIGTATLTTQEKNRLSVSFR